jgi:Flp pilus assembly protein TadG
MTMRVPPLHHFQGFQSQSENEKSTALNAGRTAGRFTAARIRTLLRNEGSSLVEMALTLPVVLIIMTGIFAFSIALNQRLQLTEAVSAGGRVLALDRGQDADPCTKVSNVIYAAAPGLAKANMTISFTLNTTTTTGTKGTTTACDASGTNPNPNLILGDNATIVATYPCTLIWYKTNFGACTLTSQITEQVQ